MPTEFQQNEDDEIDEEINLRIKATKWVIRILVAAILAATYVFCLPYIHQLIH